MFSFEKASSFLARLGAGRGTQAGCQREFRKDEGQFFAPADSAASKGGAGAAQAAKLKAKPMTLADAKAGARVKILKIRGGGAIRQRLLDMGVAKGAEVKIVRYAPLMDPVQVNIRGYDLALRVNECSLIDVEPLANAGAGDDDNA